MGCPCCVDQLSGPVIDCKHNGHDWKNPCGQCLYNGMRNMNEEEILQYQIKQYEFIRAIPKLAEEQNKEFSEETLRRLAQGVQDYNDSKIVEREWRKPSLWKRIKDIFK